MMSATSFTDQVRSAFPVFDRTIAGRPIAFFDGPGGTQVPKRVADAVAEYMVNHSANTHGEFATSMETDQMIAEARSRMAAFLGAGSPREIVFGANMTTLTLAFSRALGREWGPGDEIIVTDLDHQANVAPWRLLAEDRGMTVHVVAFDPETLMLDYDALESRLSSRTRLVAIGAASNAVGTVSDVRRATAAARAAGALSFVDAVAYAPHRLVDVQGMGCDFLACSAYKFFGPHIGVLWGRTEHLERYQPYKVPPASDEAPERWETGTQNHAGMVGAGAAVEWIASLAETPAADLRGTLAAAMARIERHESALFSHFTDGLAAIPGVRLYGVPRGSERTPTAAFTIAGVDPAEAARSFAAKGVFVWNGDFYATTVCGTLGLSDCGGLIRAGLAPYNTANDVERILEGVRSLTRA